MIIYSEEGFYFDRIHITSWCSKWVLEKQLPIKMNAECKSLKVVKLKKTVAKCRKAKKTRSNKKLIAGYKSKLEVIAPTAKFLRLLSENEAAIGKAYRISYVEMAHDVFCESAGDAELKADILFDNLRKKYSFCYVYEKLIKTRKERMEEKIRGLFASRTFYSSFEKEKGKGKKEEEEEKEKEEKEEEEEEKKEGNKRDRFIYVIYARHSKINNKYCTHSEWRITGSGLIKKKAHIMTVKDFCSFDIGKFFREKELQYLVKEKIDILALGKWLKGYDGRRKPDEEMQRKIELTAKHYMGFRIDTYSDLVLHFKSEKEQIKKKPGARSEWEKRLMTLSSYERFRDAQ
jgi:hypothetical protein